MNWLGALFALVGIVAVLVFCAALVGGRYETVTMGNAVVRTDRLTGEMIACDATMCVRMRPDLPGRRVIDRS